MEPFEWIALVGAAAWLPQIASWVYKVAVTPRIHLVPDREIELGYTNYGPIINLRASLFAGRKDAIVEEVYLTARHERGREVSLVWQSYIEKFSEIRAATGETAEASRDQPATALKASTALPTDRFIRFQDPEFQSRWRSLVNEVLAEKTRLEAAGDYDANDLIASREYRALVEFIRHGFPWEAGEYTLEVRVKALGVRREYHGQSTFSLRPNDIDRLQQTVERVLEDMEAVVRETPMDERTPGPYNWTNPMLESKDLQMQQKLLPR